MIIVRDTSMTRRFSQARNAVTYIQRMYSHKVTLSELRKINKRKIVKTPFENFTITKEGK